MEMKFHSRLEDGGGSLGFRLQTQIKQFCFLGPA